MPKPLHARAPRDEQEERQVRKLAGARHAPGDWIQRAKIVALSRQGMRGPVIAARVGCHPETVRRRLRRFNTDGLDGSGDRLGPGRKPRITEVERGRLIALARSAPPGRLVRDAGGKPAAADEQGAPEWMLDALAAAARAAGIDVHRSQVRRILRRGDVRWRGVRSWSTSADPGFAPKGRGSSAFTPPRRRGPR